jgi:prohibitin 1
MAQQLNFSPKQLIGWGLAAIIALVLSISFMTSWEDVAPGEEAFVFRPYQEGVDTSSTGIMTEGTYFIAPWNSIIKYPTLQESRKYESTVMDKNGTDINVRVTVNFSVMKTRSPFLHLMHGKPYVESFVNTKVYGANRDVIGRYTYEEVYSTKREALEGEIEEMLRQDFKGNNVILHWVEIDDVNLPQAISDQIVKKEEQKQKNLTSALLKIDEKNRADARIEKSRGDSALVVSANFKALAIEKVADQLAANPEYIRYIKWKGYSEGKGSPNGDNNVYGSGAVSILKGLDKQ